MKNIRNIVTKEHPYFIFIEVHKVLSFNPAGTDKVFLLCSTLRGTTANESLCTIRCIIQVHLHVEKHHVEDIAGDGKAWLDATW